MLRGKTALVTGASRGIGSAIAVAFAQAGANVAVVYAGNTEAAEKTLTQIEGEGARGKIYRCDVSDFEAVGDAVNAVTSDFGGVDILVNNAGVTDDKLLMQMSEESFDKVISVNLKGAFNMIKHLSRPFIKKRSGRIINISSVVGIAGNAGQANYAASKAGLIGLTKATAKELSGRGVTCNAVAPGFISTEMTEGLNMEAYMKNIPLGRCGAPEDVAAAVLFLAGDAAGYITGEVIKVDGGMFM